MDDITVEATIPLEDEARLVLGADGSIEDANETALRLLGATFEEIRSAAPGTFSTPQDVSEQAALRQAWIDGGAIAAVGRSEIRRADGATVLVRYVIGLREDGRYLVGIRPIEPLGRGSRTVLATPGAALAAWRAAERRLEALEPGSAEWDEVQDDIASFREEYRRLFEAHRQE